MEIEYIDFKVLGDDRGSLISLESQLNIPFEIKRVYYIFKTKDDARRGLHAHKRLNQVMICLSGSCKLLLDDGISTQLLVL
ncbi:FdtA/QdtA family cupin domain-containing protein, partial [bacterium]|nr:FdtA/QdtA family cupin domain-containing protein [bacterium]